MSNDSAVERGKSEIREDIASGKVPGAVRRFSQLHDFVDANEYGSPSTVGEAAEIQSALDSWLVAGRP